MHGLLRAAGVLRMGLAFSPAPRGTLLRTGLSYLIEDFEGNLKCRVRCRCQEV